MITLTIYPESINERHIATITDALHDGKLIIYPTDTLYAIGCDALNQRAIERLCKIKGINPDKQLLSVVCADLSQASEYARIDNRAFRILKQALPGPFTFVLPPASTLPKVFKGRRTVGVRIPDNPIARAIAEAMGSPIVSSSISFDPEVTYEATEPSAVSLRYEGLVDMMVDGGEGSTDLSTVVDLTDSSSPTILREGVGIIDLD